MPGRDAGVSSRYTGSSGADACSSDSILVNDPGPPPLYGSAGGAAAEAAGPPASDAENVPKRRVNSPGWLAGGADPAPAEPAPAAEGPKSPNGALGAGLVEVSAPVMRSNSVKPPKAGAGAAGAGGAAAGAGLGVSGATGVQAVEAGAAVIGGAGAEGGIAGLDGAFKVCSKEVNPELGNGGAACPGPGAFLPGTGVSLPSVRSSSVNPPLPCAAGAAAGLSLVARSAVTILIRSSSCVGLSSELPPSTTLCTTGSASGIAPNGGIVAGGGAGGKTGVGGNIGPGTG